MFAILETGGKQYKVHEGDTLDVEKLAADKINENAVSFETVLLFTDGTNTHIGNPYVPGCVVSATVLGEEKTDKVIVFKKKPKKQYKRTRGHRQVVHRIKIEAIRYQA